MYVILVALFSIMEKQKKGLQMRKMETVENQVSSRGNHQNSRRLLFFDDYFKRTGYGSDGTDSLALAAPPCASSATAGAAEDHHVPGHRQGIAGAGLHAESAAVTLFWVDSRSLD